MEVIESFSPFATGDYLGGRNVAHRAGPASNFSREDFSATLLAMAGHDLRQPLQLIVSAHDILATMLDSTEQREELAQAAAATAQLTHMLGQLVEAVQLHERAREDLSTPVLLRPVLEGVAAEFAESARLKGIIFRVASARGAALSHPVLLTSILRNLIRNAIDYTPAGGSVTIGSHLCGSELRIDVCDTGVGISANALSTIFDAFQRGDQTQTDGLGLGLFIVKHAAKLLGHRVEVEAAEGCGSCFTVVARTAQFRRVRAVSEPERKCNLLNLRRLTNRVARKDAALRVANGN